MFGSKQRLVRGYFHRRWMAWLLTCAITIQRAARSRLRYKRVLDAAPIRLQALVRGFLHRKHAKYGKAAVVVQVMSICCFARV